MVNSRRSQPNSEHIYWYFLQEHSFSLAMQSFSGSCNLLQQACVVELFNRSSQDQRAHCHSHTLIITQWACLCSDCKKRKKMKPPNTTKPMKSSRSRRCKGDQPILLQLLQFKLFIPLFLTSFSSVRLNVKLPWYKLDRGWGERGWELAVRKSRLSCVLMKGSCWSSEHEGLF